MLTNDRKKHIWSVAELLKKFAFENNMTNKQVQDLYTLGLVHDIGYEFAEEKDYLKHNSIGGNLLKVQGYKYWQEVYYHNLANSPYKSYYLDLLNCADMHVDGKGNYVSFEDRLKDMSFRHNVPVEKLGCFLLVEELKQKGFK